MHCWRKKRVFLHHRSLGAPDIPKLQRSKQVNLITSYAKCSKMNVSFASVNGNIFVLWWLDKVRGASNEE